MDDLTKLLSQIAFQKFLKYLDLTTKAKAVGAKVAEQK